MRLENPRPRRASSAARLVWLLAASVLGCALSFAAPVPVHAATMDTDTTAASDPSQDLLGMSLEDAMNVKLTTASKKEWPWFRTAAAVYVISSEDMWRSGSRNIAEALRLVPGLEVARIDGSKWAVSARGFNGRFANKLLVLVDGRSVYHPMFGGVYWDALEFAPDDIERIEVIRGPGATLWGANAVNGVINIITKDSGDTRGLLVDTRSGTVEQGFSAVRYGGAMGPNSTFRVFGQGLTQEGYPAWVQPGDDGDWHSLRGGFRADWNPGTRDHLLVTGDAHRDRERQLITKPALVAPYSTTLWDDAAIDGANVTARWTRTLGAASDVSTRATFDRTNRRENLGTMEVNALDLDFQHRFARGARNETVWGLSYRLLGMNVQGKAISVPDPERLDYQAGGFVQHNLYTRDQRGTLTLGTKLEQSSTSKLSVQPSVNMSFQPTPRQTVWGSVSYALRTVFVGEENAQVPVFAFPDPYGSGLAVVPTMMANPDGEDERLIAYETGYRVRPVERATLDVAFYWNEYSNLRRLEPGPQSLAFSGSTPYVLVPLLAHADCEATGRGVEAMLWVQPSNRWQVRGAYTHATVETRTPALASGSPSASTASEPPLHSGYVQSLFELRRDLALDAWLRMVDRLPASDVPAYVELDARLGWRPAPSVELAIAGSNLLHARHMEFVKDFVYEPSWVERGVQLMLRYRY